MPCTNPAPLPRSLPVTPHSSLMAVTNDDDFIRPAVCSPLTSSSAALLPLAAATAFLKCPKDGTPGKSDGKTCASVCLCVSLCKVHRKTECLSSSAVPRLHVHILPLFVRSFFPSLCPPPTPTWSSLFVELCMDCVCMDFLL